MSPTFDAAFRALTGNDPFPWQRDLFENHFALGKFPDACTLPTGLGKTSVVAVWLLALAANPTQVPRRLVYVVNRRTVVDQTTKEVEKYRERLLDLPELLDQLRGLCALDKPVVPYRPEPLALSTLRGQFADNREWSADPSRPAVVCGTVDMIGSRLLFSGYGCGFKTRPLHAGFLGQDALLVHDEAHLEPAFQTLVTAIAEEQKCEANRRGSTNPWPNLRVTALTATPREGGIVFPNATERAANDADPTVQQRVTAKKRIELSLVSDEKAALVKEAVALASARAANNAAVVVFVRSVERAGEIATQLGKAFPRTVEQLNGTLRGYERDRLVTRDTFRRFLPGAYRNADAPAFLVCTSAGEVGVNISGDHLVCDLSTFDSMAQRFGRVNRFGDCPDTHIDIVHPPEDVLPSDKDEAAERKKEKPNPLVFVDAARRRTLALLRELNGNASPAALGALDEKKTQAAFTPTPTILPTSDILFDSWALTSVRGKLPGRPPVEPYLHGLAGWEPPETHVAWRDEVSALDPKYASAEERAARQPADRKRLAKFATDLLGDYPLKPHELLRDTTRRVFKQFEKFKEPAGIPVWLVDDDDEVSVTTLGEVIGAGEDELAGMTVVLPPQAGGLSGGLLTGGEPGSAACDVADQFFDAEGQPRRKKQRSDEAKPGPLPGMRLVREYDTRPDTEDDAAEADDEEGASTTADGRYYRWYVRLAAGDDDGPKMSEQPIPWPRHSNDVTRNAERVAPQLLANRPELQKALVEAAKLHDLGKHRKVWQRSIGNPHPEALHEKGGLRWKPIELTDYRHEFGSLLDAAADAGFNALEPDERELVLHLIAAHHGRGRPHFPADEAFDPERPASSAAAAAREVPRRFAALQRKYGRWGLAYLESLLRAADYAASASPSVFEKEGGS